MAKETDFDSQFSMNYEDYLKGRPVPQILENSLNIEKVW